MCTGGEGNEYIPNIYQFGGASLLRLSNYVRHEWESKSVRVNEVFCMYMRYTLAICLTFYKLM